MTKIIRRNSDNVVLYAGDTLVLNGQATNGDWADKNCNSTTHTMLDVTLPPGFKGGQWTYIGTAWALTADGQAQINADIANIKVAKNLEINQWRATANQTFFTHTTKQIACDPLSRSDIDAVMGSISMEGVFPVGFPGAWKAMDNSIVLLPTVAAFKAMYASMTAQGSVNFGKSQTLKAQLAAATTVAQIAALVWP